MSDHMHDLAYTSGEEPDVYCMDTECGKRFNASEVFAMLNEHAQLEADCQRYRIEKGLFEAELEERTQQYHLAHAKILSREAIIEQLSESELAKDVIKLEAENERLWEMLQRASHFVELSIIESAPAWDRDSPFQKEIDALKEGER